MSNVTRKCSDCGITLRANVHDTWLAVYCSECGAGVNEPLQQKRTKSENGFFPKMLLGWGPSIKSDRKAEV
ncbi:MAG: hypothetical protein FWC20_01845 [Oscillospiraceae bacterium]|nr:hypothetical protein [Oscillospiraceae bacterium]MCL2278135.1 hypothetical protein [Oscillospiraceae bacterium]